MKRSEYISRPSGTGIYDLYYQDDHEGNITHLTDPNGSIIEWYRYDAFGAPTFFNAASDLIGGSNWNNRFLFTGREHMLTFSVYEYRNRAYHPALGRFMSEDPKGFDAGDYNLFRYCHNDPEDLTDPMGLDGAYVSVNPVETIQLRNPLSDSIEATQLQKIQQAIRASQNGPQAQNAESVKASGQLIGKENTKKVEKGSRNDKDAPTGLKIIGKVRNNNEPYADYYRLQLVRGDIYLTDKGSSAMENVTPTGQTRSEDVETTNGKFISMNRGVLLDRVGPKKQPGSSVTTTLTTHQIYTDVIYKGQVFSLQHVEFDQRSNVQYGNVTTSLTPSP